MKHNKSVCVLGDGAWGTAVATLLAEQGYQVTIWSHDLHAAHAINADHDNKRYLPGIALDHTITATGNIKDAVHNKRWIFSAIPVAYMRAVIQDAAAYCVSEQVWVVLSKGIEQDTLLLPSQILDDVLGYTANTVILSGPSYAHELATKKPTAVTLASDTCALAQELQMMLANNYFRPYVSSDVVGVQAGGAFKNVIALGMGMLQGADCADNTKAFFITRGLHEIALLTELLGGKTQTVYGLAGVGDLVLTSLGKLSRNTAFGQRLGKGERLAVILKSINSVAPEGINTLRSLHQLQKKFSVELPLMQGLHQIVFGQLKLSLMLEQLMNSSLEREC